MNLAGIALLVLVASLGISAPLVTITRGANANTGYVLLLKEAYGGLLTALSKTQQGTPQHQALLKAVDYIKMAIALYEKGNYTGSTEFFNMAMTESAAATSYYGPALPPGTNASRESAIKYAYDLQAQLGSVTNSTLRSYITGLIQEALNLLKVQASNASQEAQNIAKARHLLGLANSALQKASREKLAKGLILKETKEIGRKKLEEELVLSSMLNMSAYILENSSALNSQYLLNGTLVAGTIGVYNGQVYAILGFPVYYISLGNYNYSISLVTLTGVSAGHSHAKAHIKMDRAIELEEGIVAQFGSQELAYIMNHSGSILIVFRPTGGGFSLALFDIGQYSAKPSGPMIITYSPTGAFSASLDEELLMGLNSIEAIKWQYSVQAFRISAGNDYINITWTFTNGQQYGLLLN